MGCVCSISLGIYQNEFFKLWRCNEFGQDPGLDGGKNNSNILTWRHRQRRNVYSHFVDDNDENIRSVFHDVRHIIILFFTSNGCIDNNNVWQFWKTKSLTVFRNGPKAFFAIFSVQNPWQWIIYDRISMRVNNLRQFVLL